MPRKFAVKEGMPVSKKRNIGQRRAEMTAAIRGRILEVTRTLLQDSRSMNLSLESVAAAAGVSRLTIYNQFGSRGGLFKAVYDHIALRAQLDQLFNSLEQLEGHKGLRHLIEVFCYLWGSDPALATLHSAIELDEDLRSVVRERDEHRRALIKRMLEDDSGEQWSDRSLKEAVDLIFGLTNYEMFAVLSVERTPEDVAKLITLVAADVAARLSMTTQLR